MPDYTSVRSLREQQVDALIAGYHATEELGQPPDQASFVRQHPEFAEELREYFSDLGQLAKVALPLDPALEETQSVGDSAPTSTGLRKTASGSFGDYEILEELGAGGMGVVYKARQTKLKKIVALKMIKAGHLASDAELRRFQAEAQAAAKLDHPGIVAVHEVGVRQGQHYYAMDFVAGGSLSGLHRDGPVAARRAAELVQQLAEAMHYAHGQGIVHRDLKPANVLLSAGGAPRITDFGLAKRLWSDDDSAGVSMTETGQILGTAGYMSPEQAAGKTRSVGPPADIYALGAVLYALFTSRAPFVGESQADTVLQVIHKEPVSPRVLNPSVPRDLETICLKCLEKETHRRYGTAQLLADDLGRFLGGRPVLARPVGQTERLWRWCHRQPLVASLVAAIMLSLCGGVAVSMCFAVLSSGLARKEAGARVAAERVLLSSLTRSVSQDPQGTLASLDKVQEPSRGFLWHHLSRTAHYQHRTIEVPGTIRYMWMLPQQSHLVLYQSEIEMLDNQTYLPLWQGQQFVLLNIRGELESTKILDARQLRGLLGESDSPASHVSRPVTIPEEYGFRVQSVSGHMLTYSIPMRNWTVEDGTPPPGLNENARHDGPELESIQVDDKPYISIARATLADRRVVTVLAPDISGKQIGDAKVRKVGRERALEHSTGGWVYVKQLKLMVSRSAEAPDGGQIVNTIARAGLPQLDVREARLTPCLGTNRVILSDWRSAIAIDIDSEAFHPFRADERHWGAGVSPDGRRVVLVYPKSGWEQGRVGIKIFDESGQERFHSWYDSPRIKRKLKRKSLGTFTDVYSPPPNVSAISADGSTYCFVEPGFENNPSLIHVISHATEGACVSWQAHSKPIVAAAFIPSSRQTTTVDNSGLVRNWSDSDILSEWQIPEVSGLATAVAREDSLLVLRWEAWPGAFDSSVWADRGASISAEVFDRNSGKHLFSLPKIELIEEITNRPKQAHALSRQDLTFLPLLSADGRYVAWSGRNAEGKRTLFCRDLVREALVVDQVIPEPLRVDFGPGGTHLAVLSAKDRSHFILDEVPISERDAPRQTRLALPANHQQELAQGFGEQGFFTHDGRMSAAFRAFRELDEAKQVDWLSFFNRSGGMDLATLYQPPLVLELRDGRYLDCLHRTKTIRLRAKDTKVIREFALSTPHRQVWATVVDDGRTLLTLGPDQVIQLWSIEDGEPAGSIRLPFDQVDGFIESTEAGRLLFWGDSGRLVTIDIQ